MKSWFFERSTKLINLETDHLKRRRYKLTKIRHEREYYYPTEIKSVVDP